VVVTGYTDDVPLSNPTDKFRTNADIAAARGKTAVEHLAQFAKANAALTFDPQTGDPAQAPYPNDSPQNRRLNRTVTVQIIPAP
jgi:flagellar motor protein MotB